MNIEISDRAGAAWFAGVGAAATGTVGFGVDSLRRNGWQIMVAGEHAPLRSSLPVGLVAAGVGAAAAAVLGSELPSDARARAAAGATAAGGGAALLAAGLFAPWGNIRGLVREPDVGALFLQDVTGFGAPMVVLGIGVGAVSATASGVDG